MKTLASIPRLSIGLIWLTTMTLKGIAESGSQPASSIPVSELGAKAGAQYQGGGLSVVPNLEGALLRCVFQKLEGQVTREGLWLSSTVAPQVGDKFRVVACAVGREGALTALPTHGTVAVTDNLARCLRPGLTEEYSTSVDGVRHDFVVDQRPEGEGNLRLELVVTGARAKAAFDGAYLVLDGSGRKLAYNRLRVNDATGKELTARMQVASAAAMTVVVEDATAAYPLRIDPTFSDANWLSMGGIPGANNIVWAAVVDGAGNLYVGGAFTSIGTVMANYIAKWDGSSWSALSSGMGGGVDGTSVSTLVMSGTDLYAGGNFTTAGGISANRVAKWNGSAWSALGSGMNGPVKALAVSGSDLYAGGQFSTAGGSNASCIAKWDGSKWSALGGGTGGGVYGGSVWALAVEGTNLYAGGWFTGAVGIWAKYVAKWDGSSWSALGSGMAGFQPYVYALAVVGTNLFAGGYFTEAGGVSANHVAKWDGSSWSPLGSGLERPVMALAVAGTNLCAGGFFHTAGGVTANGVAKWNGSSWSAFGEGMDGSVYALVAAGTNLYAGGSFTEAGGVAASSMAKWSGSSWSPLGSGMGRVAYGYPPVSALAVAGTNLYAGGTFATVGSVTVNGVAKWNGSNWSALGSGMGGVEPYVAALAVAGKNLFAGGYFTEAGGVSANFVAKWDGSSWSALGEGMNGYVSVLAVSGSNLYAGGGFDTAGGVTVNGVAKWDGSSWTPLGEGMFSAVSALAVSGTNLFAASGYGHVARWDGSSWSPLGEAMNSWVGALAVSGADLYAGGVFTTAGGILANCVAKWDGSSWSPLGAGMGGVSEPRVSALAVSGVDLYAGGFFLTAGGVAANSVAKWDGNSWSPLASGMGGGLFDTSASVFALAVSATDLYAGGDFFTAGDKVSAYVAQAHINPLQFTLGSGRPAMSNGFFQTQLTGPANATVILQASSNLTNWTPIVTNTLPAGVRPFSLPMGTNHQQFYRAWLFP